MRSFGRQSSFNDPNVERQTPPELSGERRALIGAIVRKYDDPNERWLNRKARGVALLRESAETSRQSLLFIFDRYGDDEGWSDCRDEPGWRQGSPYAR